MEHQYSKRAVWLAADSEYGDRLIQIAVEHSRLARELVVNLRGYTNTPEAREKLQRISTLRQEREAIIQQFEEVPL